MSKAQQLLTKLGESSRCMFYVGTDAKEITKNLESKGIKIYSVSGKPGDQSLVIDKSNISKIKSIIPTVKDDDFEDC